MKNINRKLLKKFLYKISISNKFWNLKNLPFREYVSINKFMKEPEILTGLSKLPIDLDELLRKMIFFPNRIYIEKSKYKDIEISPYPYIKPFKNRKKLLQCFIVI